MCVCVCVCVCVCNRTEHVITDGIAYISDGEAGDSQRLKPVLLELKAPSAATMPREPKVDHVLQVLLQMRTTGVV